LQKGQRRQTRTAHDKREHILEIARAVFEAEGLEGASLRTIAAKAGYTPAALYFHFESKEAVYAELLHRSLVTLGERVQAANKAASPPEERLRASAMAFFDFYVENPRDLDLGFYLLRGGMKPAGLGNARDEALNAVLGAALRPIADAAVDLGASRHEAERIMVDCFAHATGLLLLLHTGRIRMFGAAAPVLMEEHVRRVIATSSPSAREGAVGEAVQKSF